MEKIDYHVQEIAKGIWAIDEFSMEYLYVIQGAEHAVLLDTGTGTCDLKSVVDRLVSTPYSVVATHAHMDHVGGVGQFDTLHIHRDDIPCFSLPEEVNPVGLYKRRLYCRLAIAAYGEEQLPFRVEELQPVDMSKINLIPYEDGAVFDLGGRSLEAIHMPGHTNGSCCFLDKEDRILFAGDNFGEALLLPRGNTDSEYVRLWLSGAEKIKARENEFDMICAGHFCPLDKQYFDDMITTAKKLIAGEISETVCQVLEMLGPMYCWGKTCISMDPENIRTRDYSRLKNPRRY